MRPSARLSVDLGTTHTVAVVRRGDQQPRSLLFDGTPLLPSGVHLDPSGTVHTGRDAQRLGMLEPHRFEPYPKRRVDEGSVLLGDEGVPVASLLAAVLRRVAVEAGHAGVASGDATVLTCPADWGQPRREVLRAAGRMAGLGEAILVDEPVAAATYCVDVLGQQVPLGAALGIFDFGGGTLDIAVVRRELAGFRLLGTGGLDDLGGLDIDAALVGHLGQLIAVRNPRLWRRLGAPDSTGELRDRQAFWTEVRIAKEMLSRASSAPVHVPGRDDPLYLTRDELDRVAGPLVARAVDETRRVLERTGVVPAGLLLVGGTSRLPLVASRLHARIGVPPTVPEQPELPVAYGGMLITSGPVRPSSAPPDPASSQPWGFAPVSPPSGHPMSAPPTGYPVSPPRGRPVPPPDGAPTGSPPAGRRQRRPRRTAIAVTAAALAVAAVVAGGVVGVRWLKDRWSQTVGDLSNGLGNQAGSTAGSTGQGTLTPVHDRALPDSGAVAVVVAGDRAFYASVSAGHTDLVALPAAGGKELWQRSLPVEPTDLALTVVGGLLVVDGAGSALDEGRDVRAAVDGATGNLLWKQPWENRRDVAFIGTDAIVETQRPAVLQRVDLTTGKARWSRAGPDDLLVIDEWRGSAIGAWPAAGPSSPVVLPPSAGSMYDTFAASTDVVELNEDDGRGYVLDAATGRPKASGALPLDDEHWVAFDGLAIGKLADSPARDAVAAYRVDRFTKVWQVDLLAGTSAERVKPCGPRLVCVAVSGGDADRVIAVNTVTGKEVWHRSVEWSDEPGWYACGERLLFGDATFDTVNEPLVLDTAGKELQSLSTGSAMAVHGGRFALRDVQVVNMTSRWTVSVVDAGSGRRSQQADIGSTDEVPMDFSVSGDLVAVVTSDRHVKVFRVGGLS